jgi:hypothetical protein
MLADSVESAARVLPDPNPERIRELVDRIVNAKIAAGQLDQSPLTLREINRTKDVLARALSSMYHHRVDYPAQSTAPNGAGDGDTTPASVDGAAPKSDGSTADAPGSASSGGSSMDTPAPAFAKSSADATLTASGDSSADVSVPVSGGASSVDTTASAPAESSVDAASPTPAGSASADGAGMSSSASPSDAAAPVEPAGTGTAGR